MLEQCRALLFVMPETVREQYHHVLFWSVPFCTEVQCSQTMLPSFVFFL